MPAAWLKDTVFYEIYPQSFYDANGDGTGDLQGIIEKLDYIRGLGCNALWINPCFDSPFRDAGYDVRDYRKVAARYGTNEDLYRLFREAHQKGMRVLLDLVPGHTSEEHPWFLESRKEEPNALSGRYIWTDSWFRGCRNLLTVGGEAPRDGTYILNFFKCQPALNYGFLHPAESWQMPMDAPDALATREAIKDIMRFWLSHGCDGFRVDMADSLVKFDDADKSGTTQIWLDIREMLDREYPEAALVSEWCQPKQALRAGFDMDFYLNHDGNGYSLLMREYACHADTQPDLSYFRRDGRHDIRPFIREYMDWYTDTRELGYISVLTCNHDTPRPRRNLDIPELKLAYAFLFTLPGVPFLYYGDEIGMNYLKLPTKEGGYTRTGSRTPMQWTEGRNKGFSAGRPEDLYLPVDSSADAPTVEREEKDPDSLLRFVRQILQFRHAHEDLQADAVFEPLHSEPDQAFVYRRGNLKCALNPAGVAVKLPDTVKGSPCFVLGLCTKDGDGWLLGGQSFAVFEGN